MRSYAGSDVSEQATHVCVVDAAGEVVFRGVCRTEPGALRQLLAKRAPDLGRAVLETGALASWLSHGLGDCGDTLRGIAGTLYGFNPAWMRGGDRGWAPMACGAPGSADRRARPLARMAFLSPR
jgi:hypothetical protein